MDALEDDASCEPIAPCLASYRDRTLLHQHTPLPRFPKETAGCRGELFTIARKRSWAADLLRRYVHSLCGQQFNVRDLGPQPNTLKPALFCLLGDERELVLMFEPLRELVEVGCKAEGRLQTLQIS